MRLRGNPRGKQGSIPHRTGSTPARWFKTSHMASSKKPSRGDAVSTNSYRNFENLRNSVQSKYHCAEMLTTHTAVRLSRLMGYFKFYEIYHSDMINCSIEGRAPLVGSATYIL